MQSTAYGNGLAEAATHTLDYELGRCQVTDGATKLVDLTPLRTDALNVTGITDGVTATRNQSFGYSAANRLTSGAMTGTGGYGTRGYTYDGVGNRLTEQSTPVGGTLSSSAYAYPGTSNRISTVTTGAATRTLTHDAAGNLLTDSGSGGSKSYTYNKRNRLSVATVGALTYTYTYNALAQLASRVVSSPAATTHFIHDRMGNVIAETAGGGATGTTGTTREYIYLYETEIAPTMGSRTGVDRPLAVVNAVNTASPATWWVSVDHLNRPVKMTSSTKAGVWDVVWQP
jgi:hypothetical protein